MKTRIGFAMFAIGALLGIGACGSPGSSMGNTAGEGAPAAYPAATMGALDMSAVHEAEERIAAERPDSPAIKRTFLRGHFETRNSEFPIEVEQAMAGVRTDRPVIVWAASEPKANSRLSR
ncbi:hypothetical protein LZC95_31960 [Pendulispora brunnea]|uniref:Uncharacterized protein n=1 Tax=Pendulispora brunnea TaxID=2905690 RepID=A0ABZ2K1J8_9BACT